MWNGGPSHHDPSDDDDDDDDSDTNRLTIQSAIAAYTTGTSSDDHYDELRRQDEMRRQDYSRQRNGSIHSEERQNHPSPAAAAAHHPHHQQAEDSSDDDDDDRDEDSVPQASSPQPQPRGKPEAMAARLASAARVQEKLDELEAEKDDSDVEAQPVDDAMDIEATAPVTVVSETPAPPPKKKNKKSLTPKKKATSSATATPCLDDSIPDLTDADYENLEALMVQFCRVPLLAEFSRPVALLHPELMSVYTKIVDHPVDLGKVCRGIRRRQYVNARSLRLDAWRIFANCIKYHSSPSNKEAVPSFVSIALHLRDYFNALWQEHMLPSDPPPGSGKKSGHDAQLRAAVAKRQQDRKKRLVVSGLTIMTGKCAERAGESLTSFIDSGGCVDRLDKKPIFGDDAEDEDLDVVVDNLKRVLKRLETVAVSGEEYGVDEFDRDIKRCYTEEVFENNPALRMRIGHRLDRFLGKIVVPIHEASSRGVTQSSTWGCMAAAVWARESSKKPFWPALVLGIMAPEDQREEWHNALTERNEGRLPEKLRAQLMAGKRKSEGAIKKQSLGQLEPQSFFLVEFLGTHEFIWVKESDIVENFDPAEDPNTHGSIGGKKKRNSRSNAANVIGSKTYASAVEEGKWALEEFELQLQDTCGDPAEEEDDGAEMNYSYSILCQSDDEADDEADDVDYERRISTMDIDECNELLATEGLLDFTAAGRKNAKKRAQALKKQKADAEKKKKLDKVKKQKEDQLKKKKDGKAKERETKKELKDLEKKRKKRGREREKALKGSAKKTKKPRTSSLGPEDAKKGSTGRRNVITGKRDRATAIVEGYLTRVGRQQNYKSLGLGGVMTIPAALVDSSGLLGMALAFRAASGELPMPDESGNQDKNLKPWDAIDVESKKTEEERTECLENQISLLEKEVLRLRSSTAKRRKLCEEAIRVRDDVEEDIAREDKRARQNPFKKKKAVTTPEKKKTDRGKSSTPDSAKIDKRKPADETEGDDANDIETTASHELDDENHPPGSIADTASATAEAQDDGSEGPADDQEEHSVEAAMDEDDESL